MYTQTVMIALSIAVGMMAASVTVIALVIAIMHWRFSKEALKEEIQKETRKIIATLEERIAPLEARMLMELADVYRVTRPESEPKARKLSITYSIDALSRCRWTRVPDRDFIRQNLPGLLLSVAGAENYLSMQDLKSMRDALEKALQHIGVIDDEMVEEDIRDLRRNLDGAILRSTERDTKQT